MNIGYVFDSEQNLIISVWNGIVTFDSWRSQVEQLVDNPKFSTHNKYLVDIRYGSADPSIGKEQIQQMAGLIGSKSKKIFNMKMAVVGTKEFEKSLLFRSFMNPETAAVIVFTNMRIACTWLEIDQVKTEKKIKELREKIRNNKKQKR
jgi:hypothetical protein